MSTVNTRIKSKHDTTANWNAARGFIPLAGEIIIYDDYETSSEGVNIPSFKVGDGQAYVQDLPFVNDDLRHELRLHTRNGQIHVSPSDRLFWNDKINIDDSGERVSSEGASLRGENLIFSRDYFTH